MTDYKSIFGKPIKTLTTDPTDTGAEGQIWYNSTAGAYKSVLVGDAWVSGAPLSTPRFQAGMVGIQTAALIIGSENPGGDIATVEEYNGSGWSSSPSINTARQGIGSTGTTSAALAFGGLIAGPNVRQTLSEEWNGTAWTAGNALSEAGRSNISGAATQTAGVAMFSGELTPDSNSGKYHEQYDGTSWTASTKCPTQRVQGGYAGDQTAGIGFAGRANTPGAPSVRNLTSDIWNGSTWTSGPSGITARSGHSSHGTDSSAIFARGSTNPGTVILTSTEEYDGTSFSATPSVTNTGQGIVGGHAQPSPVGAAWIAAGSPVQNQTEEFNRSTNVITPGAWASGGNYPTTNEGLRGAGTQTAAFAGGGTGPSSSPTRTTAANNYDGTAWTASGTVPYATGGQGYSGTQTAGLFFGGLALPFAMFTTTVEYDGSTWTAGGALPRGLYQMAPAGTQTATLSTGGRSVPAATNYSEVNEYNGTSWSAETAYPTAINAAMGTGTSSAALVFGGSVPSPTSSTNEYDGSTWTAGGNLITGRYNGYPATAGSQTAALLAGGATPSYTAATENYDGSTWATGPSMANVGASGAGAGTQAAALRVAGNTGSPSNPTNNVTEEFTGETSALNFKTLTTS